MLVMTSAWYDTPADSRLGQTAPALNALDGDSVCSLGQFKGQYVLVSFWSSTDPESRLTNRAYDRLLEGRDDIVLMSVNLDDSNGVFEQIVEIDALRNGVQCHVNVDRRDEVVKRWRLGTGNKAFMVDPQGKIVAVNPEQPLTMV